MTTACLCLVPLLPAAGIVLGVVIGLRRGRRNRRAAAAQAAVLSAVGLVPGEGGWHQGTVAGRSIAVKAKRGAKVNLVQEVEGGVTLTVSLVALVPLDVPLAEHLHRNDPGPGAHAFERLYYAQGGAVPSGIPPQVAEGLVQWAVARPDDRVELGPRNSPQLYAGNQLPQARSLVRVEGPSRLEPASVQAWLEDLVARVAALDAVDR